MSEILGTVLYIYNPVYPKTMSRKLFEELASEHYILYFNGELVVTNKFTRAFAKPPTNPITTPETAVVVQEKSKVPEESSSLTVPAGLNIAVLPAQKISILKQFIIDAQVPEKSKTRDPYWLNRFNTKAENILIKALKNRYQYDILVTATRLYYKSGGFPKTIANYFIEGIWEGCYADMERSLRDGTAAKHIENGMNKSDEEGFSRYKR